MGWILPPGGVPELAHTIAHNLYGKPPKQLAPAEQEVVVAWIAGRAPVSEAEVRRDLLKDWVSANEVQGQKLSAHNGGAPPPSTTTFRAVNQSALGVRMASLTTNALSTSTPLTPSPKRPTVTLTPWTADKPLTLWEGAAAIPDAGTFATLGKTQSFPGTGSVAEVKFLLTGAASTRPALAFINTNAYDAHKSFASSALGAKDSLAEFNDRAYFDPHRDVVCGSVVRYGPVDGARNVDGDGHATRYALQFLPTDPMTPELLAHTAQQVKQAMPFADVVFHPQGPGQTETAKQAAAALKALGVDVVSTPQLLAGSTFAPLNPGVGYGVLRFIDGSDPRPPTAKDVVIFARLPNDLSHTAGVITLDPQTPLSHVNLKAKQNNTPNAFIQGAEQQKEIKALLGSVVRFEVTERGFSIRAATEAERVDHLEKLRPPTETKPPRNLSQKTHKRLSDLSYGDLAAFGAKTVNAAEVERALPPENAVHGAGAPFSFYDDFMKASGLYDTARAMMAEPRFQSDETYRHAQLKRFRRQLRDTPVPPDVAARVQALHDDVAALAPGRPLRLRSATNNEDLPGFNGAGLYSSRTWDPSAATSTQPPSSQAPSSQRGGFVDVMKDVWSSLWSFRAFEERSFHKIDHFTTAMGVLVHPSYDADSAAGVAVTKNIYDPSGGAGLYVNVQPKDDAVTSPEGGAVPEELLLRKDARTGAYVPQVLAHSNLTPTPGAAVLSPQQTTELARLLETVTDHFRRVHQSKDPGFALDVEFIVDRDRVRVVQARPWVDG